LCVESLALTSTPRRCPWHAPCNPGMDGKGTALFTPPLSLPLSRVSRRGAIMGGTILIVEDDAATAGMLRAALESEGYRVLHAVDGEGLRTALDEEPDVVLLDVNMPGMGGPEVARRLRADPATARIPIVAMSGRPVPPDMVADDRLAKPFALADLFATVERRIAAG